MLTAILLLSATLSADEPKPPEIRLIQAAEQNGLVHLSFAVTNPNPFPLPFIGYLPNSFEGGLPAGTIAPIYRVELRQDTEWKPHQIGWCGTGIGPVTLPAKGKATFAVAVPLGTWREARVGITWFRSAERKAPQVRWGQAIRRQDVTKKKDS